MILIGALVIALLAGAGVAIKLAMSPAPQGTATAPPQHTAETASAKLQQMSATLQPKVERLETGRKARLEV